MTSEPRRPAQPLKLALNPFGQVPVLPGAARLQVLFKLPGDRVETAKRAARLLSVMDEQLVLRPFLTGAKPTIADVAGYTYIAHAPEGGISLEPYPQVRAWLARIEQLPRFVGMPKTPAAA